MQGLGRHLGGISSSSWGMETVSTKAANSICNKYDLKPEEKCQHHSVSPHSALLTLVTPHSGHSGWEVAKLRLHRTGGHQCCGKQCNTCFPDISCQKHPTSGETLDWPWQWHWMALKMTKCEYYTWHIIAHLTESDTGISLMVQRVENLSISF